MTAGDKTTDRQFKKTFPNPIPILFCPVSSRLAPALVYTLFRFLLLQYLNAIVTSYNHYGFYSECNKGWRDMKGSLIKLTGYSFYHIYYDSVSLLILFPCWASNPLMSALRLVCPTSVWLWLSGTLMLWSLRRKLTIICIIILLYSSPLSAGVLGWGLGVVGVEVVRLMAGAVWAGLHRLGVDHTHSADLRWLSEDSKVVRMTNLPRYCWPPAVWGGLWGSPSLPGVCWDWWCSPSVN